MGFAARHAARRQTRRLLVIAQFALTLVLLQRRNLVRSFLEIYRSISLSPDACDRRYPSPEGTLRQPGGAFTSLSSFCRAYERSRASPMR